MFMITLAVTPVRKNFTARRGRAADPPSTRKSNLLIISMLDTSSHPAEVATSLLFKDNDC
jgi:hypothetical protein